MTNPLDAFALDMALVLLFVCAFFLVLGLLAGAVEWCYAHQVGVTIRCRLRYWKLRYQEWRTRKPLVAGESLWSRIQRLEHEDTEHVIGGKPRW